jgi:hypothetical protein
VSITVPVTLKRFPPASLVVLAGMKDPAKVLFQKAVCASVRFPGFFGNLNTTFAAFTN